MSTHMASRSVGRPLFCTALPPPTLRCPKPQNRQMSAGTVRVDGAGNLLVRIENSFPATSSGRNSKAQRSHSEWCHCNTLSRCRTTIQAASNAKVEGGDSHCHGNSTKQSAALNLHQRREVLWATTGTLSYLSTARSGQSEPVPPSDLQNCSLVDLQTPGETENCCPSGANTLEAVAFQFEIIPMRTRRPAHVLSKDLTYVAKYNEAYRRMKALPDDDPRSFHSQWHLHCALCDGAFLEPGNTSNLPLQYHFSWLFLPWHRMFLYFHERILGHLISDPTFALPFWNWDNQRSVDGGNRMPRMVAADFGVLNSELRIAFRDPAHYPPALVDLTSVGTGIESDIVNGNLSVLHSAIVSTTATDLFMGGPYIANETKNTDSPGSLEFDLHNAVHGWTGDPNRPDNRDMGGFVFAARDPLFYQHHANVDRLWEVWKSLPMDEATRSGKRGRKDPSDPDFLNTKFAFYDQTKRLVHVKVSDTLDMSKLSYCYQAMASDSDWINFVTRAASGSTESTSHSDMVRLAETTDKFELMKDAPRSFLLSRREPTEDEIAAHADERLVANDLEETLLVKGVSAPKSKYMIYRVFINLPTADENTPLNINEFVGIITHIPHSGKSHGRVDFRLSMGAAVTKLGIPIGQSVSVTFVPRNQEEDVPFDGLDTEWR